ncbi:regulatory protein, luxR family [Anaerosporobacter mobilis DSM 15930]|uniref:Regulatory protein, luxR family n=1 Tax=Anaerosporobacter mobilis DSM 15930 TaxID=1120996 RepID=A0A1M7F1J0_9FIRM|nr:LuxR C-terminal-related transcriptional regulator [Anaerosporobacter mobilis]SHL97891.1 regulatory protein, luxR family [Anaerosporobacter mobilis DSM 15930]
MGESWHGKLAVVSDLIYKVYAIHNVSDMTSRLFESLRMFIEYDAADLYLYDELNKEYVLSNSLHYHAKGKRTARELGLNIDILDKNTNIVYRESDYQKEDLFEQKRYIHTLYKENQFQFALHVILSYEDKRVGVINLYRYIGNQDFEYDDMAICNVLKEHLALRLSVEVQEQSGVKYTVSEVVNRFNLTPRETQVLKNMLAGKDNYQISDEMMISIFTIKKHIMNIYRKLEISSRTQLFKKVKEFE